MYTEWMYQESMAHSGIKGQKWGVRRYQNLDRTWTEAGKERYGRHKNPEDFDPYEAMAKIDNSLNKREKDLLGVGLDTANIPVEKFFFNKDKTAYLIVTDYHGKYKDEHTISGKVLGIAAKKNARGTGDTDKLISNAKKYYKNDRLVAEIDKNNTASRKLFERNEFEKIKEDDYIDYYVWRNKS